MNKSLPLLLILVCFVFSSCRKDNSDFVKPDTGNNTASTSDSYYPSTAGSVRTFKMTTMGMTSTITETFTGKTATFDNETYFEASTVTTDPNGAKSTTIGHHYEKDGVYRNRGFAPGSNVILDFEFLHTKAAVGETWIKNVTSSGTVNSIPARIKSTMKEKGISKAVAGKTYQNVMHVTMELQYDMLGSGFETSATYEFYCAKGIGYVLIETTIDTFGFKLTSQTELTSYSIK